jgi:hypothetical protein
MSLIHLVLPWCGCYLGCQLDENECDYRNTTVHNVENRRFLFSKRRFYWGLVPKNPERAETEAKNTAIAEYKKRQKDPQYRKSSIEDFNIPRKTFEGRLKGAVRLSSPRSHNEPHKSRRKGVT